MAVERTLRAMGVQMPLETNVAVADDNFLSSGGGEPIKGSVNSNGVSSKNQAMHRFTEAK